MSDLHERFNDWLSGGAAGELPRDAALHASACDACRRHAAAFDALIAIDAGAASLPPLHSSRHAGRSTPIRLLRGAVGVAAVGLLAVSVGIGAGGLLDRRLEPDGAVSTPTPEGEGILAGGGGPSSAVPDQTNGPGSSEPSASPDRASPGASEEQPDATSPTGFATPGPVLSPVTTPVTTPGPSAITPPVGTPRPSSPGGSTPRPSTPSATPPISTSPPTPVPTPTPLPTPVPTPDPTPVPTPFGACDDGIDNDGDFLTDLADPGCLLDGNEYSAP